MIRTRIPQEVSSTLILDTINGPSPISLELIYQVVTLVRSRTTASTLRVQISSETRLKKTEVCFSSSCDARFSRPHSDGVRFLCVAGSFQTRGALNGDSMSPSSLLVTSLTKPRPRM
uniref:Uncharacterized protein n=1 Tax=Cacopsylla melanoneura TaxID=428564 RepID=A0A8D8UDN0_9HEMI